MYGWMLSDYVLLLNDLVGKLIGFDHYRLLAEGVDIGIGLFLH